MPELSGGFWYPEEKRPDQSDKVEDDTDSPVETPRLEIEIPEGTLVITPDNSVVRIFEFGDGEFDHILHQLPGTDRGIAIFLSEDPVMRAHIESNPYEIFEQERPDDEVYGYYAAAVVKELDDTI